MEEELKLKIVLLGDAGVGKTSFLVNLTEGEWKGDHVPAAFSSYEYSTLVERQRIKLELWDTEVTSEYDRLRPLTYPATDLIMLCYDVSNKATLESIESKWLPEIRKHLQGTPMVLVGNKMDLRRKSKEGKISCESSDDVSIKSFVSVKEAKAFAKKHTLWYVENSTFLHSDMQDVVHSIVHALLETRNHCRCRRGQRRQRSRPGSTLPRPKKANKTKSTVELPEPKEESSADELEKDQTEESSTVQKERKKDKEFPSCTVM